MFFSKKLDIHSVIHFVGSYALVPTIMALFGLNLVLSATIALVLGILWELFDEINFQKDLKISFLDPRGADLVDIFVDLSAILLALWVF